MTRPDKPTDQDFKNFWSVFEAQQQRKREQLKSAHPKNDTHKEQS